MRETYLKSIDDGIKWIESQMLTFDEGYHGIYERIRINKHTRINWVRPDCNTEMLRVLTLYEKITQDTSRQQLASKIKEWVLRVQDNDSQSAWHGTFPFYLDDGHTMKLPDHAGKIYQNDNGRILIGLLHTYELNDDQRLLDSAKKLADYWASIQTDEGTFFRRDGFTQPDIKGPDFVLWLAAGMLMLHNVTGEEKYKEASLRAYDYLLTIQLDDGRMQTSYELDRAEDWRPLSSETSKSLYSFSVAYGLTKDDRYKEALDKLGAYVISLQDKSGGIVNNHADSKDASLQTDEQLCDLVYTQGYALMALIEAAKVTEDPKYKDAAFKLADFLVRIQCRDESHLWDGGWRGSYNIVTNKWDGRADQNNHIDEGGMYSVYTGWTATNIMYGLLQLCENS